jgi:AcrR family transcriptional regulator
MASASGNADDQRERLVTLARAIIEERGGSGLTMHELAARAGISPPCWAATSTARTR